MWDGGNEQLEMIICGSEVSKVIKRELGMPWLAMFVTSSLYRASQSNDETFLDDQS
jgi:hypothetical protein